MHISKSIRLSEDAYERLAAHKREDETFSDVVRRLAGERSFVEIAGIPDDDEAEAMRDAVEERRARRGEALEDSPTGCVGPDSCSWTRRFRHRPAERRRRRHREDAHSDRAGFYY
jgi:predicted CopG family antitoxin